MHELVTGTNDVTGRAIRRHCGAEGRSGSWKRSVKGECDEHRENRRLGRSSDIEEAVTHVAGTLPVAAS